MIIKWMKRLKLMRISKYVLIITLLMSLVFCGFTVYGARIGNFNIYLHANDIQLAIYMEDDKSDLGTHLSVPTLDQMDNTTFEDLAVGHIRNRIVSALGPKNDDISKTYLCFSFVLVNLSDRIVDFDMDLTVTGSQEGIGGARVEEALRVLVLWEENYQDGSLYDSLESDSDKDQFFRGGSIYALPETSEENKERLERETHYTTEDFISTVQIFKQYGYGFEPGAEIKFTVLMWLEGWDAECVNSLYGGRIRMRLDITGR